MRNTTLVMGVAAAILLGAGRGDAQQAAPNPLDVIPDKMPFDVPYGPPIGVDRARSLINATEAEAKKHGGK
jgi:glc operon protein GlcG